MRRPVRVFVPTLFSHQDLEPVPLMHSVRLMMLSVPELEQVPTMDSGEAMAWMEVVRSEDHDDR